MATKRETDRFVLSASGMRDIKRAPQRKQGQTQASKPKGKAKRGK